MDEPEHFPFPPPYTAHECHTAVLVLYYRTSDTSCQHKHGLFRLRATAAVPHLYFPSRIAAAIVLYQV